MFAAQPNFGAGGSREARVARFFPFKLSFPVGLCPWNVKRKRDVVKVLLLHAVTSRVIIAATAKDYSGTLADTTRFKSNITWANEFCA